MNIYKSQQQTLNEWKEVATTPSTTGTISKLIVYKGNLYGCGGYFGNVAHTKSLFRWNNVDAWIPVADVVNQRIIRSLCVYNNKLYGGTEQYTTLNGGELYEWNEVDAWIQVAPKLGQGVIQNLIVHNNKLYGGTSGNSACLYEWNGVNAWVEVAPPVFTGQTVISLAVFDKGDGTSRIYASIQLGLAGLNEGLYEWNGTNAWVGVADNTLIAQEIIVYDNNIYATSGGELAKWNKIDVLQKVANQIDTETPGGLCVFQSELYAGTISPTGGQGGRLFKWNGTDAWIQVAGQQFENTVLRNLVVYNNKMYASSGSRLFEWQTYSTQKWNPLFGLYTYKS